MCAWNFMIKCALMNPVHVGMISSLGKCPTEFIHTIAPSPLSEPLHFTWVVINAHLKIYTYALRLNLVLSKAQKFYIMNHNSCS